MENKNCPNCIRRENTKTKLYEFVCKKDGYRKCNTSTCPYENNEYDNKDSAINSYSLYADY